MQRQFVNLIASCFVLSRWPSIFPKVAYLNPRDSLIVLKFFKLLPVAAIVTDELPAMTARRRLCSYYIESRFGTFLAVIQQAVVCGMNAASNRKTTFHL